MTKDTPKTQERKMRGVSIKRSKVGQMREVWTIFFSDKLRAANRILIDMFVKYVCSIQDSRPIEFIHTELQDYLPFHYQVQTQMKDGNSLSRFKPKLHSLIILQHKRKKRKDNQTR